AALLAFGRATSRKPCPDLLTSGRQDDGLAGRLRVEEPVGFLGLLEPPAVREEPLHVHLPVRDELGALGLALLRERPRPHQRYLPAQEIRADVERDLQPDPARRRNRRCPTSVGALRQKALSLGLPLGDRR